MNRLPSKLRVALTSAVVAWCVGAQALAAEPIKVAFVYIDPVGDSGWSYQHDLGRRALEKALGSKVKTLSWKASRLRRMRNA